MRERKREREKFSRAIKHYRTSRVRLIKSAASTTAAHREERNHYQEKKDLPLSFIPSVEKQMGHGRRKKEKWPRKKILRRLETRMGNERDEKRGKLIEKNGSAMANDNETLILEFNVGYLVIPYCV